MFYNLISTGFGGPQVGLITIAVTTDRQCHFDLICLREGAGVKVSNPAVSDRAEMSDKEGTSWAY